MTLLTATPPSTYTVDINFVEQESSPYLSVEVYGEANYDNAKDLWQRIAGACREHDCYLILGENHLYNPVSTMDAWKHQEIIMETGIGNRARVAWIDANPITFPSTEFIGQVLSNRVLINGRLFRDRNKAKEWLLAH